MEDSIDSDNTNTSYYLPPKLYHICEPWSDNNSLASTSAQNTPRFASSDNPSRNIMDSIKCEATRNEEDVESGVGLDADSGEPTDKESGVIPRVSSSHSSVDTRDYSQRLQNKPPISNSTNRTDMIVGNVERLLCQVGDLMSNPSTYSGVKPIGSYLYTKEHPDDEIKEKSDYEEKEDSQDILTERTDVTEYQELPRNTLKDRRPESLTTMYQRNSRLLESEGSSAQSSSRDAAKPSFKVLEDYGHEHSKEDLSNRVDYSKGKNPIPIEDLTTERSYNLKSADQEVEYFNNQPSESIPDVVDTNANNSFSDWTRRNKEFNYEAVKRDLADIEHRLKATRIEWTSPIVRGDCQNVSVTDQEGHCHRSCDILGDTGENRKSQSMLDIQMHRSHCHSDGSGGSPDPPNYNKSHSFTSIPHNSSLSRNSRLKWDYAADIALAKTNERLSIQADTLADEISSKSDGALPGMKMSQSQGSFVSSPDIEDYSPHKLRFASLRPEDSRTVERVLAKVEMAEREVREAVWGEKQSGQDSTGNDGYYSDSSNRSPHSPYHPDESRRHDSSFHREYSGTEFDDNTKEEITGISAFSSGRAERPTGWEKSDTKWTNNNSWKRLDLGSRNPSIDSPEKVILSDESDNSQLDTTAKPKQSIPVKKLPDYTDESGQSNRSNENTNRSTTTMESTHPGSDDACAPNDLPTNAFGSRNDPLRNGFSILEESSHGIYSRTSSLASSHRVTALPPRPTVSGQPNHHQQIRGGATHQPPPTSHSQNDDGVLGYHWRHSPLETISSRETWEEENSREDVRRSLNRSSPDSDPDKENRQECPTADVTRSERISDLQEKWDRYKLIQSRDYSSLRSNLLFSSERTPEPLYSRHEETTFEGATDSRYPLRHYSSNLSNRESHSRDINSHHFPDRVSHEEKSVSPSHKLRSNQKWAECRQTADISKTDKYVANQKWSRVNGSHENSYSGGRSEETSRYMRSASGGEQNSSNNKSRGAQTNGENGGAADTSSYFPSNNRSDNLLPGGWRRLGGDDGGDESSDNEDRRPLGDRKRVHDDYHSNSEETLTDPDQDPNQLVTSLTLTDDPTSSIDTDQLAARMKRIAALERKSRDERNGGDRVKPRLLNDSRDDSLPYDEELLRLKQLVLRHREKLLQDKMREDRRRRKINHLQDLIREKERGNPIEIYSALETDTASVISQSSTIDWPPCNSSKSHKSDSRKEHRQIPGTPPATPDNDLEPAASQLNDQFFETEEDKEPTVKKRKRRRVKRSKRIGGSKRKDQEDDNDSDYRENEESFKYQATGEDASQLSLDEQHRVASSSRRKRQPQVYSHTGQKEDKHLKVAPPVSSAPFCAQVYPPSQSWVIPAPDMKKPIRFRSRSQSPSKRENERINRSRIIERESPTRACYVSSSPPKWDDIDPIVNRNDVDEEFVDSARSMEQRQGEAKASGGGLSWYLPVESASYLSRPVTSTGDRPRQVYRSPSMGMEIIGIDPPARMPREALPNYEEEFEDMIQRHEKLVDNSVDLQTALMQKKASFISRSRERQRRIQLAAAERKYVAKVDAERTRLFTGSEAGGGVARRVTYHDPLVALTRGRSSSNSPQRNKSKSVNRSKSLYQPKKRKFTNKQMRTTSSRFYQKLPEVKQREADEARSVRTRDNRYRMKAYGEKILRAVLRKRGPWVASFR